MKVNDLEITLSGGIWKSHAAASAEALITMYRVFNDSGRIAAMNCNGYEGETHIFWDSDVIKWVESVAFFLMHEHNDELYRLARGIIDNMLKNQLEDGYYNTFYQTHDITQRFTDRGHHELYCLGHHIEAAVAWHRATGENNLLGFCDRYIDLVYEVFCVGDRLNMFITPGHEEIELALIKLYRYTGIEKYLSLAEFFILKRGTKQENGVSHLYDEQWNQSHAPLADQRTAEGHAVRANYIYTAMADYALIKNHDGLKKACAEIFEDTIERKMHINGGVGTSSFGECYTVAYDLPPATAYAETCASIGLMMFCRSYYILSGDERALDTIERVSNNILLGAVSMDGKRYFYCNPMSVDKDSSDYYVRMSKYYTSSRQGPTFPDSQRRELQRCSCCPPNLARTLGAFEEYVFLRRNGKTVITMLMPSSCKHGENEIVISGGKDKYEICVTGESVILHLPAWSRKTLLDGRDISDQKSVELIAGKHEILLDLRLWQCYTNGRVYALSGKFALFYGPTLLCAEGHDNEGKTFNLIPDGELVDIEERDGFTFFTVSGKKRVTNETLYSAARPALEKTTVRLIPYYQWSNRGKADMTVWFDDIAVK